jgi:transposase
VHRRPRHIGLDQIQRGKGQRFWTVLSDVVHGEVMGLREDGSEAEAAALLTEDLRRRQLSSIAAACTDMHRPYRNAVRNVLSKEEIVFDKFHVLQHASAALDELRRQEFFRAGAVMREHGRGKPWLLLRRWNTIRGSKRRQLRTLFAANRRLLKAYVLREQLDRLWTYKRRFSVLDFLNGWINALRWQRLPEIDRRGEFLFRHIEGIAAYCDHQVRFGVVELGSLSDRSTPVLESVKTAVCYDLFIVKLPDPTQPAVIPVNVHVPVIVLLWTVPCKVS